MTRLAPVAAAFFGGCFILTMYGVAAPSAPRELDRRERAVLAEHGIDEVILRVTEGPVVVALGRHRESGIPWGIDMAHGFPSSAGPVESPLQGGEVGEAHLSFFGQFAAPGVSAVVSSPGTKPRRARTARGLWAVIVPAKWSSHGINVVIYDRRGNIVESIDLPPR